MTCVFFFLLCISDEKLILSPGFGLLAWMIQTMIELFAEQMHWMVLPATFVQIRDLADRYPSSLLPKVTAPVFGGTPSNTLATLAGFLGEAFGACLSFTAPLIRL